jgi:hypothetical protein
VHRGHGVQSKSFHFFGFFAGFPGGFADGFFAGFPGDFADGFFAGFPGGFADGS